MPTFELLPQPWQGNVRCSPSGKLISLSPDYKVMHAQGHRQMQPGILFDTTVEGLKLQELWTVWGMSSPMDTVGRVAANEFRALVSLWMMCNEPCVMYDRVEHASPSPVLMNESMCLAGGLK